jgi:hypothetical protein
MLTPLRAHSPTLDSTLPDAAPPSPPTGAGHHEGAAGITGPIEVTVPAAAGRGWLVAENYRSWPVRLDRIVVDPDARVVDRSDFADWPLLSQLSKLGVQAHMDHLFHPRPRHSWRCRPHPQEGVSVKGSRTDRSECCLHYVHFGPGGTGLIDSPKIGGYQGDTFHRTRSPT